MQKKVIGYVRVSTNQQDLQRQRILITEYCSNNDYDLVDVISDQMTGATGDRDGYIRLLETRRQDADIIVVSELSRLSRQEDIIEVLSNINSLIKKGIDIVFLDNGQDSIIKGGNIIDFPTLILLAAKILAAAEERKNIIGRMLSGKYTKWQPMVYFGSGKPFGYKLVRNPNYQLGKQPKTILIRDEAQAAILEEIFTMIINGQTCKAVAINLQGRGILNSRDADFSESGIRAMIHNPIYKGEWTFSGKTMQGDAILTPEVWDKAQEALKNNRINTIIRGVHFNPLKGILKCRCGKGMTIGTQGGYPSYRCATRKDRYYNVICDNGCTKADNVIAAVWNAIVCSSNNVEFSNRNKEEVIRIENNIGELERNINNNRQRIEALKGDMDNIAAKLAYLDGSLFELMVKQYKEKEEAITRIEDVIKAQTIDKSKLEQLKRQIEVKNTNDIINNPTDEEMAAVFKKMLRKVTLSKDITKRYFLIIEFKNNVEIVYILISRQKPSIIMLPTSFKYNRELNKVGLEVADNTNGFIAQTHTEYYSITDIERLFPDIIKENDINGEVEDFE